MSGQKTYINVCDGSWSSWFFKLMRPSDPAGYAQALTGTPAYCGGEFVKNPSSTIDTPQITPEEFKKLLEDGELQKKHPPKMTPEEFKKLLEDGTLKPQ